MRGSGRHGVLLLSGRGRLVLPYTAAGLEDDAYNVAAQASAAREAAVYWDDDYSKMRLFEVRSI